MSTENLNIGEFWDSVARLHEKLKTRGFEVFPEEVKRKFYGPATRDAVRECQTCHGLKATGEVNEATAAALSCRAPSGIAASASADITAARLNQVLEWFGASEDDEPWVVRGKVTRAGNGVPEVQVTAFDRDLRHPQLLGRANSGPDGSYYIEYRAAGFDLAERLHGASPWLIVEARVDPEALPLTVEKSKDVQRDETIDFELDAAGQVEWQLIHDAVLPLLVGQSLRGQALALWELDDNDVAFLAVEAGIDEERLQSWVSSARMAQEAKLLASDLRTVSVAEFQAFYAWLRDGQPRQFADLIRVTTAELLAALERAAGRSHITPLDRRRKSYSGRRWTAGVSIRRSVPRAKASAPASAIFLPLSRATGWTTVCAARWPRPWKRSRWNRLNSWAS